MSEQPSLNILVGRSAVQGNPIVALRRFLEREQRLEQARDVERMRFVGYVLDLSYDEARIITSDPYKLAVGGIPRGSFLIMTPIDRGGLPLHFTLLRVSGVSTTPLSSQVQQTYFELHKRSMPELDVWTQAELQWGALNCDVLGMYYPAPNDSDRLEFSGDVNNVVSAHRYKVFAPDAELLGLIVNGLVPRTSVFQIGVLRTMESRLGAGSLDSAIPVLISMDDFKGRRTAMFGKTRLGKSNVVKLLAQGMLDASRDDRSVGQLIFDINGEYANDNPQDGSTSIRSANEERCFVYALTSRTGTPSKPLRLNFYENPNAGIEVIGSLLEQDGKTSNYIRSFAAVRLHSVETLRALPLNDKRRAIRKIQLYWAILKRAGFEADEQRLRRLGLSVQETRDFNPHFSEAVRTRAYREVRNSAPPAAPATLEALVNEMTVMAQFRRAQSEVASSSGGPLFDADDIALLEFLDPVGGSGPSLLRPYRIYHHPEAGDFVAEILQHLDRGGTVILDLGNATDQVRKYFADMLSIAVFRGQEQKFVENTLGRHFVQLYFEEAHNIFPPDSKDLTGVYARFAKEGAKFHIGMVYSTQSPSTINRDLLAQTENFFVGHLSSQDEVRALSRLQVAYAGIESDILRSRTPGFMRMLTMSHRFVVPLQAERYAARSAEQVEGP